MLANIINRPLTIIDNYDEKPHFNKNVTDAKSKKKGGSNDKKKLVQYPLGIYTDDVEMVGYIEQTPNNEPKWKTETSPGVDSKKQQLLYTRTNPPSPVPTITSDFKFDGPAIAMYKEKQKKSKGGTKKNKMLPKLKPVDMKNKKYHYRLNDPSRTRRKAINEGINYEINHMNKTKKQAAISKKGRFNILRIYRRNKNIKDCDKITKDMRYIDKKYKLGKTKNICGKNKTKKLRGGADDNSDLHELLKQANAKNIQKIPATGDQINRVLLLASKKGLVEPVIGLFLNNNVNPNYQNEYGNTPLIVASDHGHNQIVKILLNNGANPNIENQNGWTAFDFAIGYLAEKGLNQKQIFNSELIKLLTNAGALPGSAFHNMVNFPKDTRAFRHMTTEPGQDD